MPGRMHRVLGLGELALPLGTAFGITGALLFFSKNLAPWATKPRTLAKEYQEAQAKLYQSMPRQGSDTPIQLNPIYNS